MPTPRRHLASPVRGPHRQPPHCDGLAAAAGLRSIRRHHSRTGPLPRRHGGMIARLGVSVGTRWRNLPRRNDPAIRGLRAATLATGCRPSAACCISGCCDAAPRLLARPQPQTIVHGDAHAWNCFLPTGPGEPRLFDWDAWRIDHASDDLAYLMAVHWYPDQRRAFEARLSTATMTSCWPNPSPVTAAPRCRRTIASPSCGSRPRDLAAVDRHPAGDLVEQPAPPSDDPILAVDRTFDVTLS